MRKFICEGLIFLIFCYLIILSCGIFLDKLFAKDNYHKSQWINRHQNLSLECVIVGNSRASQISLNEDINYLNLGEDGIGMKLTYLQLHQFYKNNNKAKLVLIQGDYMSISKFDDSRRSARWLPFMSDSVVFNLLAKEDSKLFYHQYLPGIGYFLYKYDWGLPAIANTLFKLVDSPWGEKGYYNVCAEYVDTGPLGSVDYNSYEQDLKWLIKINDLANVNGSKVAVFTAPYYKMKDSVSDVSAFKNKLHLLDIEYFDHSRIFKSNKAFFRDNNHLNCHGCKAYESILYQEIFRTLF